MYISNKIQTGGTVHGMATGGREASSVVAGEGDVDDLMPELQLAAVKRALDQAKDNEVHEAERDEAW
jgi:hypothetical protein